MGKPELTIIFEELYNSYLRKTGLESREKRGYKHFHPSSFGECLRKIALQYYSEIDPWYKPESEIDPKLQRIFSTGHAIHHRIQGDFASMGILRGNWKSKITGKIYGKENKHGIYRPKTLEELGEKRHPDDNRSVEEILDYSEIMVRDTELNFEGHVDAIIDLVPGDIDERFIVDFKTINGDKFKIITEPDPKYVTQITIYMMLLDIPRGVIFYQDKNKSEIKEFLIVRDEKFVEHIRNSAKKLLELLKSNKLPKIPMFYSEDKVPCMWCEYKEKCYGIAKRKKELL